MLPPQLHVNKTTGQAAQRPRPRGHLGFNMLLSPEPRFLLKFLLTNRGYTEAVIMKTHVR